MMMKLSTQAVNHNHVTYAGTMSDRLRVAPIFAGLSAQEMSVFESATQSRTYKKGKVLYVQEESADYFYVICCGWIKLFHSMPDGEDVVVDMLTVGDLVGESAIFEQGLHTSSAEVIDDVHVLDLLPIF